MRKKHPIKVRYALQSVGHAGSSSIFPAIVVVAVFDEPTVESSISCFVCVVENCRDAGPVGENVSEEDMVQMVGRSGGLSTEGTFNPRARKAI